MSTDKNIPICDPTFNEHSSGIASTMSWKALSTLLERSGYVHQDEQVSGFRVTDRGVVFYMEKKEK